MNVFKSLLTIKNPAELKLTLLILARAVETKDLCPALNYSEFRSLTGLSPATIARGLKDMLARSNIVRHITKRSQPARYQVLWEKFGLTPGAGYGIAPATIHTPTVSAGPEFYFTNTGFLDLLPRATDIARELGYGEDEMIQAVCMVFDRQKTNPPTRNRTAWFLTVFREKLHEAHAEICAYKERKNRIG
jgi:5-methylcytosine-specific restriction endonuclease McrA